MNPQNNMSVQDIVQRKATIQAELDQLNKEPGIAQVPPLTPDPVTQQQPPGQYGVVPPVQQPIPKESIAEVYNTVPKRTAAAEVYNHLRKFDRLLIGAILGCLFVVIGSLFGYMGSGGVVVLMTAVYGWFLVKYRQEANRLKRAYNL